MNLNLSSLGYVIKNYRKYKDLTTQQLANKLNVSAGLINNIENAKNDVFKLELLYKLIKELDIPTEEFLTTLLITKSNIAEFKKAHILNNESESSTNNYISLISSLFMVLISEYEDKEKAAQLIGNHLLEEMNSLKKIKALK